MNDHSVKLLADLLGVSIRKVARAHQLRNSYFLLKEPKEDGTMREIWAPHEDLKDVQHLILKEFLYRIPLGENEVFFFGFQPGRSWVDNARFHAGVNFPHVLRLDLKSAFPSITREYLAVVLGAALRAEVHRIRTARLQRGEEFLQPLFPAREVGWFRKLLTTAESERDPLMDPKAILIGFLELLLDLTTFRGRLVQGAPTSPRLLNLAVAYADLIGRMRKVLTMGGVGVIATFPITVYADDFTLSSVIRFDQPLIEKLILAIEGAGTCFRVNRKKIRVYERRQIAPLITGLRALGREKINGRPRPIVALPKQKIRQLRGFIHSAHGVPDLEAKINGHIACLKGVYGKIPRQLKAAYDQYCESIASFKKSKAERRSRQIAITY